MNNISKLFIGANLYSIEYAGLFILKFSVSNSSMFYDKFQDIVIELISGCEMFDENDKKLLVVKNILSLYGLNVLDVKVGKNNQLFIYFENSYKIISVIETNELYDRNWLIRPPDDVSSYIMSDSNELFSSDNMKYLL